MEKHLGWSWQGFPPTQNFLLRLLSYTLAFVKLHMDEASMRLQNLYHVEPVFDALVPSKIEFSVLETALVEIPCWQNQNSCWMKNNLRVSEADCEVSSLVQQGNFLHFGQLALRRV